MICEFFYWNKKYGSFVSSQRVLVVLENTFLIDSFIYHYYHGFALTHLCCVPEVAMSIILHPSSVTTWITNRIMQMLWYCSIFTIHRLSIPLNSNTYVCLFLSSCITLHRQYSNHVTVVYTYDSNIKVEWIITIWLNDKQNLLGEAMFTRQWKRNNHWMTKSPINYGC